MRIVTMRTAVDILRSFGLSPPPPGAERYYVTCSKCSTGRSREHRASKCLGITVNEQGVHFGCNHCGWTDGAYYNGRDDDPVVATYNYTNEDGTILSRKVRTKYKNFWQERPDQRGGWRHGGWIKNIRGIRRVLYHLPEVMEAIANERTILTVEGEKDADALWSIGLPATCNAEGAAKPGQKPKWRPEYSAFLRDADVVIIPDHDEAGYAHAEATASMLLGTGEARANAQSR
jgi:hypothetical protein